MLRAENARLAQQFSDNLVQVLRTCNEDVEELKQTFNRGPLGRASEAVAFSASLQTETEELRAQIAPLSALAKDTPPAQDLISAACAQLHAVNEVLDLFEAHMQNVHGVTPVTVPSAAPPSVAPSSTRARSAVRSSTTEPSGGYVVAAVSPPRRLTEGVASETRGSGLSIVTTPEKTAVEEVEEAMPATPRLEDYGICDADIRALAMPNGFSMGNKQAVASTSASKKAFCSDKMESVVNAVARGSGNLDELLQESISVLQIETPVQVAAKFEARRHNALKGVMQSTTPRMKAGGTERTLDYTGLAGGYFSGSGKEGLHRALNFDDTPVASSGIRGRVADAFDGIEKFWKGRVDSEALQDVAVLLAREGDRTFSKDELVRYISQEVPHVNGSSAVAVLSKMKVIVVEKRRGEEAIYRYGF